MTHKTFQRTTAVVCAALIAGSAFGQSSAAWGEQSGRAHERPRFMMYANLPFGDAQAGRPSYGLRFESAPLRSTSVGRMPLLDFQIQPRHSTLLLAGVPALRMKDSANGSDSSMDSFLDPNGPWFWVGGAAVGLAILCATHHLICTRDKDGNYSAPTTPPPTTGGTPPTTGG